MSLYRMKISLTLVPFFLLLMLAIFVITLLPYTEEVLLFFAVCLIASFIFLCLSFIKFKITEEYISRPFAITVKKIFWKDVFEIKISKSHISGYLFIIISYFNASNKNYFIIGDWFEKKDLFLAEIRKNAIKAKIYE